ncbi:hypothetical protein ACHQM5_008994 [Ranunculus cassubicifolius]
MMENYIDDQSSGGWFEVKKKHRKFSTQGSSGGFSNKIPSTVGHSLSYKSATLQSKQKSHASKAGQDSNGHFVLDSGNSRTMSEEADKALPCLDKCVVSENIEIPTSSSANSTSIMRSNGKPDSFPAAAPKEKLDTIPRIPKIKWGDLEDDVLLLCRDNLDVTEVRSHNLGDEFNKNPGNPDELISGDCSSADTHDKAVVTPADAGHPSDDMFPVVPTDKSYNGTCIDESCSGNLDLSCEEEKMMGSSHPILEETLQENVKVVDDDTRDGILLSNPDRENSPHITIEEVSTTKTSQEHNDNLEDNFKDVSGIPVKGQVSTRVGDQDIMQTLQTNVAESPSDSSVSVLKDLSPDCILNADNTTDTQIVDVIDEGESSESKERFRERLWCFLFENLNRSIDELYLLCELECDLEQMKEATLVLEEAGSDFKELKSRVEGFEIMKRPLSQPLDGMLANAKADHRRTHALSWEVRRMAASPHRAEILSSSLEAFKKIQKERTGLCNAHDVKSLDPSLVDNDLSSDPQGKAGRNDMSVKESSNSRKQIGISGHGRGHAKGEKKNMDGRRLSKTHLGQNGQLTTQISSTLDSNTSLTSSKARSVASVAAKSKRDSHGSTSESENQVAKKDKIVMDTKTERNPKYMDPLKRHISLPEKDKERRDSASWRSLDAWKEKRNWEDILASPVRTSSRVSHSPGMNRKSMERARVLHDKLMSPEKKKKTALDLKKEAEERHARATRIRSELENERVQRLQRTSEKLKSVNEWQAVRTVRLKEGMYARQQRSESRHEAHLAQVVRRAGDESSKVNEVRFITSLNEENKKHILRQKLHDSELRRAEKLQTIKTKQKEDIAREEAVSERRRILQAEKLQRLAEIQRKKEEAHVRREEERKASSAAREARAIEQLRRKEVRAKVQQEEAELLAQKLAERLRESEQRRKFYLEQIRERASMDFRDQSSPLLRRSLNKDSLLRSTSTSNIDDYSTNISGLGGTFLGIGDTALQHSLKRRIKKIRQRLMALKHEFIEPPVIGEISGTGYRSLIGTARAKIGRWLLELQRFRQARKEGASSIGLIVDDMIKFLNGKEPELHASRQAGLLDFIASALPASHTSKPEACQVTIYLLKLLRVVLTLPANRSYFVAHNLLPPLIPMLSAALENYIKIAASLNVSGSTNLLSSKTSVENFDAVSEVLEGFIWTVTTIMGHICSDERQVQMKDYLLELVISYQVIHRLRELFALQDRPQVEGSCFPSPIILSLNMLVVLTSRPTAISSIDWGSFSSKISNESQEMKHAKSLDFGGSSSKVTNADRRFSLSESQDIRDVPLSEVPEDRPLGESTTGIREDMSLNGMDPEKDRADASIGLNHTFLQMHVTDVTGQKNENIENLKQPVALLLSAITETGLVSLLSLLTAVLLQANNRLSSEQGSYVLPSNFEEVATGVLKVLNNLALLDITLMQRLLARTDLQMEFFHLMSFLLSHCTSKWKSAIDQVGLLLLESLLLLGYFSLFHPGNQAVLRWGKSPTILHKVCDLPFVFFSDQELMPILAGTLVSACYGCEQNRGVVQQELSIEMLLSLVSSCRNGSLSNQISSESSSLPIELPVRSTTTTPTTTTTTTAITTRHRRLSLGKGGGSSNMNSRVTKLRNQKEGKATKTCEEQWALKHNLPSLETSSTFMLHSRFPASFVDRVEEFFSSGTSNNLSEDS